MRISDWSSDVCPSDLLNARDDACRTEQNEAAEDHRRAVAPVDPSSEHHEADRGDRAHRDDDGDRTEKRPLEPSNRRHEHARARRVGELLRMRRRSMAEAGDSPPRPHNFAFRSAHRRVGQALVSTYQTLWPPVPKKK